MFKYKFLVKLLLISFYFQVGKYQCRAQNKLGSAEETIEVVRQFTPNCVVGLCEGFTGGAAEHNLGPSSGGRLLLLLLLLLGVMKHLS